MEVHAISVSATVFPSSFCYSGVIYFLKYSMKPLPVSFVPSCTRVNPLVGGSCLPIAAMLNTLFVCLGDFEGQGRGS